MIIGIEKAAVHLFDLEKWAGLGAKGAKTIRGGIRALSGAPTDLTQLISKVPGKGTAARILRPASPFGGARTMHRPAGVVSKASKQPLTKSVQRQVDQIPQWIASARKLGMPIDDDMIRILLRISEGLVENTARIPQMLTTARKYIGKFMRENLG